MNIHFFTGQIFGKESFVRRSNNFDSIQLIICEYIQDLIGILNRRRELRDGLFVFLEERKTIIVHVQMYSMMFDPIIEKVWRRSLVKPRNSYRIPPNFSDV